MQPDTVALSWAQPSVFSSARFKLTHKSDSDTIILDDSSISTTYKTYATSLPQSDSFELYVECLGGEGVPIFSIEVSLANGFSCTDVPNGVYAGESLWYSYRCPELYPSSPWQPTDVYFVLWDTTDPFNAEVQHRSSHTAGIMVSVPYATLLEYLLLGIGNEGTSPIQPINGYIFGRVVVLEESLGDSLELADIPWTHVIVTIPLTVSFHSSFIL